MSGNSKGIQAVAFDFGGVISKTLFETHPHSEEALGLAPGSLQWRGPFDADSDELWRRMQADEISERDYWLTRAREVGAMLGEEWNTMQQLVTRVRGHNPAAMLRPEALASIERMAEAGFALAILSNELELFYGEDFRERLDFLHRFSVIVDASYSDILKPDPRAYERCLDQLGLAARQCLFIDDQARNIAGAQAVGMHTVHFDVCAPLDSYNEALTALGQEKLAV